MLAGILLFRKTQPTFLRVILIGLIITFLLTFTTQKLLINISFFGFGILTLIFTVLSGLRKKWLNLIIGFFAFGSFVFSAMHFPYSNGLKLLMIVPIISYILSLRQRENYENALSISTLLIAYLFTEFLDVITPWFG